MTSELQTVLEEAEQTLAEGGESDALELVEPHMTEAAETLDDTQWQRVVTIVRAPFAVNDNPELVAKFDAHLVAPRDPRAAYDLGYALVAGKHPALASGVLTRGLRYGSDDLRLRNELAASLELQGRYREAAAALEATANRADTPFLTRYLYAFNLIASGDVARATPLVRAFKIAGNSEHAQMRARLDRMLRRHEWAGDDRSPRAQQFVLTGALLLEDERVDYREESWTALGVGLRRLNAVLDRIDRKPPRVVSLQSARQNVLGLAASQLWGLPLAYEYEPAGDGLYVSDNLASLFPDISAQLRPHRPRQIFYAHYATADVELPVCADAIGVRGARVVSPWDLYTIIDYRRSDLPKAPPAESDEKLAARIANGAREADLGTLTALTDFAHRAAQAGLLELARDDGERERLWAWSR